MILSNRQRAYLSLYCRYAPQTPVPPREPRHHRLADRRAQRGQPQRLLEKRLHQILQDAHRSPPRPEDQQPHDGAGPRSTLPQIQRKIQTKTQDRDCGPRWTTPPLNRKRFYPHQVSAIRGWTRSHAHWIARAHIQREPFRRRIGRPHSKIQKRLCRGKSDWVGRLRLGQSGDISTLKQTHRYKGLRKGENPRAPTQAHSPQRNKNPASSEPPKHRQDLRCGINQQPRQHRHGIPPRNATRNSPQTVPLASPARRTVQKSLEGTGRSTEIPALTVHRTPRHKIVERHPRWTLLAQADRFRLQHLHLTRQKGTPPLTQLKIFCGTPSYMAPEIVQKK